MSHPQVALEGGWYVCRRQECVLVCLLLLQDKRRRLVTYKLVLAELLEALEAAHATGIGEGGCCRRGVRMVDERQHASRRPTTQ